MEIDGVTAWVSPHGMQQSAQRLRDAIHAQGMSLFGHIDHAEAAAQAGLALRPLQLFLFGNPLSGTKLMQAAPTVGLDLPLRAVLWVDDAGSTWFAYNDPGWIAARHGARFENQDVLARMRQAMTGIAEFVTQTP